MVAIMALSVCAAVNLTISTKVEAADTATKITLTNPPANGYPGKQYFVGGWITEPSYGKWLGGQQAIELWRTISGKPWTKWKTVPCDMKGSFGAYDTQWSTGSAYYYARYAGNPGFQPSKSGMKGIVIKYSATLSISVSHPWYSVTNTVTGNLKDQYGYSINNVLVKVYKENSGTGHKWSWFTDRKTVTPDGKWTAMETTGWDTRYYAFYPGDVMHWSVQSRVVDD